MDMWAEILKIFIPVVGSVGVLVIGWYLNKRRDSLNAQLEHREQNYRLLIESIQGFRIGHKDIEMKRKFIDQLNLLWLYAPDSVIHNAGAFARFLDPATGASREDQRLALGKLMCEIRRDLISGRRTTKTSLSDNNFTLYQV